jgi:hypothetical protein
MIREATGLVNGPARARQGKAKQRGPAVLVGLRRIGEAERDLAVLGQAVLLGCWCRPLACHGDVVRDAVGQGFSNVAKLAINRH